MIGLDARLDQLCAELGGLYRRYSDDILIICPEAAADRLANELSGELGTLKLEVHPDKVERTAFALNGPAAFLYLGFIVPPTGALIRPSSLSRQWRKAKRSLKRTKRAADAAIESGTATKAYTKKLRRRFSPVGSRNFSSYARRSAQAFGSKKIIRQVARLERKIDAAIRTLPR
jgi:hypothetical protein